MSAFHFAPNLPTVQNSHAYLLQKSLKRLIHSHPKAGRAIAFWSVIWICCWQEYPSKSASKYGENYSMACRIAPVPCCWQFLKLLHISSRLMKC